MKIFKPRKYVLSRLYQNPALQIINFMQTKILPKVHKQNFDVTSEGSSLFTYPVTDQAWAADLYLTSNASRRQKMACETLQF